MSKKRHKKPKLSDSDLTFCKSIIAFTSSLPTQALILYVNTPDLCQEWLKKKYFLRLTGKCLKARFMGGGGNPAKKALKEGYIDDLGYRMVMAEVECYASEFRLYQVAWEDIHDSFKHLKDSPTSEIELFFDYLKQCADSSFLKAVNSCAVDSISSIEAYSKALRDVIRQHINNPRWIGELTAEADAEASKTLPKKDEPQKQLYWRLLAFKICQKAAEHDESIRRAIRQFFYEIENMTSVITQACQRERKANAPHRVMTHKWENGNLLIRTSAGYRPVAELGVTIILVPEKIDDLSLAHLMPKI